MIAFAWSMYWLVWQLHWTLRWILLVILILFTLRTCCGITDIDRWVLEPMHREFPELTESIMRYKRSAELKIHRWRGGRAAQMSQGIYPDGDGSDEEGAPLLSQSGRDETPQEELERLRRESLMTSQENAQLRAENQKLKGGMGQGFDAHRGDQMEEV